MSQFPPIVNMLIFDFHSQKREIMWVDTVKKITDRRG